MSSPHTGPTLIMSTSSSVFDIKEHIIPCQHIREYPRSTANDQEEVLKLAVKEYVPLDNPNPQPGDVTFIGGHANGFPKELYEPLYEEINKRSKANGFRIRSIIIADIANQGVSGVLNEYSLGNDPSWVDQPRDLLHVMNTLRPPRPLIGIGHSMGGNALVNLSTMHPRLLHSLILLDPVIQRRVINNPQWDKTGQMPARLSTVRRDLWPSRAAAVEAFSKQKFYQRWDPRVLDRWLRFGLRDTPTPLYPDEHGAVTLTTTKHQEVFTFVRPVFDRAPEAYDLSTRTRYPDLDPQLPTHEGEPFYRPEPPMVFEKLKGLRPSVMYVFGELSDMSEPGLQADKMENTGTGIGGSGGLKEGRVTGVTLKGVGHLVAMEDVEGCVNAIVPWVSKELKRWEDEEEDWKSWRDGTSRLEKTTVSEEWKKKVGGQFPRPVKGKL